MLALGIATGNAAVSMAAIRTDVDGSACGGPFGVCTSTIEARTGIRIPDGARIEASGEDEGRTWLEPPAAPSTWVRLCAPDPEPLIAQAHAHASTVSVDCPGGSDGTRILVRAPLPRAPDHPRTVPRMTAPSTTTRLTPGSGSMGRR